MRVWTSPVRHPAVFFVALAVTLVSHSVSAQQPEVTFLGTDPVTLNQLPSAASVISGIGVDAEGNQYYADTSLGQVIELDTSGTKTVIAKGLKNPLIAVDYRGNVFVADTGTNRILRVDSSNRHPVSVLATGAASLHAIAVDSADSVFFVSGNGIVEIPDNGTPMPVAAVTGASLLAFGSAVSGNRSLYIVSAQGSTYKAYLYSYGASGKGKLSGPVAGFLPAISGGTISGFVVDPHGNTVIVNEGNGGAQIILGTSAGFESTIYSSQLAATPIVEDTNGSIYFLDSAGLEQIQLGALNFGTCRVPDHGAPCSTHFDLFFLNLHFGGPANVSYQPNNPTGNFQLPFGSFPGDFDTAPVIPIYFIPEDSGLLTGTLTITDQNSNKLSIALYGFGQVPYEAYYDPALNLSKAIGTAKPVDIVTVPQCDTVVSGCGGTFVLDAAAGTIAPYSFMPTPIVSGLKNPEKFAVDVDGKFYITQAGVAGVLAVGADGSRKQIATDLANPVGVTLDAAHNLYVTNGDDIVRIAPDGSESLFLTPQLDGGFKSALSLTTDFQGNLYAGFGSSPYYNRGAILKITPAGAFEALHVNVLQPVALSASRNSVLFFTDTAKETLYVYSSNQIQKSLAFGLKNPSGVAAFAYGGIYVADSGLGTILGIGGGLPSLRNFGNVPVGGSRTLTLTVVDVGTDPQVGGVQIQPMCSDFTVSQTFYNSALGGLLNIPFTFQPVSTGPSSCEMDLSDNNDYLDEFPTPFDLSGTGTAP